MTTVQKSNAREMGFQLKRDFKFHLDHQIDLSQLTKLLESENSIAVDHELTQLTILYSDMIKERSRIAHC